MRAGRYLLGLIVQSEKCGLQIDMATFLYFFYMKPSEEGRYTLYARRRIRLFKMPPPDRPERPLLLSQGGSNRLCTLPSISAKARDHRQQKNVIPHSSDQNQKSSAYTFRRLLPQTSIGCSKKLPARESVT
ncbi:hypothetical protein FNV43_RR08420 [Rhamnella rubrinervis]|uniref:Uncharacterized protein n=1 Tax=Rhamnella rubrinervis TaxID=2594499 RepID=A0A8K0H8A7_9ROSA|nr:hypothetical protein FNV43_RR08420 [Rhamnella rubrinervis]